MLNQPSQIAAFFDFDDTLISGDSGKHGMMYQYRNKELSLPRLSYYGMTYALGKRNLISPYKMIRTFLGYYKNKPVERYENDAYEFYEKILKPNIVKNIIDQLKQHQSQNHIIFIVSASPEYLLNPFVEDFNIDHLIATKLEINENQFTGIPIGHPCIDEEKVNRLQSFITNYNIDLENSFAYGNAFSDIPLINLAGNKIAVNPDPILKKHAMLHNWKIMEHHS